MCWRYRLIQLAGSGSPGGKEQGFTSFHLGSIFLIWFFQQQRGKRLGWCPSARACDTGFPRPCAGPAVGEGLPRAKPEPGVRICSAHLPSKPSPPDHQRRPQRPHPTEFVFVSHPILRTTGQGAHTWHVTSYPLLRTEQEEGNLLVVGELSTKRREELPVVRVGKVSEAGKCISLANNPCSAER